VQRSSGPHTTSPPAAVESRQPDPSAACPPLPPSLSSRPLLPGREREEQGRVRGRATLPHRSPRDPLRSTAAARNRSAATLPSPSPAPAGAPALRHEAPLSAAPTARAGGGSCSSGGEAGRAGRAPVPAGEADGGAQLRPANRARATCCSGRRVAVLAREGGAGAPP